MSKYKSSCNCDYSVVSGNSLDVEVNYCESEIRADIIVQEQKSVRLWGRIINCNGEPVSNALIKLLKVENCGNYYTYVGVAHTISDCEGFYQFELCTCSDEYDEANYKILVSKAAYGPEKVIPVNNANCDPCDDDNNFDPCKEYDQIMAPVKPDSDCENPHKPGCVCHDYAPKKKYR